MSWTDYFPVLTDDLVAEYESGATADEKAGYGHHFAIGSVHNRRPAEHILSSSLFWKAARPHEPELPPLTREVLMNPRAFGIIARVGNPWEHYVEPVLHAARSLRDERPEVTVRIHLAADLSFLLDELCEAGCEVMLMESSSLRHNPGAMWRFLAFEGSEQVTVTDSDRASMVIHDIARTEATMAAGLGSWRAPYTWGKAEKHANIAAHYRPIIACQFGSALDMPMRSLAEAFLWAVDSGRLTTKAPEALGEAEDFLGSEWPTYGFDEFFLLCVVFPRLVQGGVVTFIRPGDYTLHHLFALDIEFCTWANPASEILYLPWEPLAAKLTQAELAE